MNNIGFLYCLGGGNAEYVASREELLMPLPSNMKFIEAAAIPEVWLTAFQLLFIVGRVTYLIQCLVTAFQLLFIVGMFMYWM